jgi:uncharacterized protein (DUF2345 family)
MRSLDEDEQPFRLAAGKPRFFEPGEHAAANPHFAQQPHDPRKMLKNPAALAAGLNIENNVVR